MTDLIIIGTIGLDTIETPFGHIDDALGGSGAYASCAASYFTKPGLISIMGNDMPAGTIDILKKRGVDFSGVETKGKNFRWSGAYEFDMNSAETRETQLNSLVDFNPILPDDYKKARFVFLANVDPDLQLKVLDQMESKPFVVIDTMNYWINSKKKELLKVIGKSDLAVMNEGETRQLFDTPNLIMAGKMLLEIGPTYAIIKKGEHGALLFSDGSFFSAPSYPLEDLRDPTGAGDSFAGGLIGYLASLSSPSPRPRGEGGGEVKMDVKEADVRKAIVYGSAIASFCAENFSLGYAEKVTNDNIEKRYKAFEEIRKF